MSYLCRRALDRSTPDEFNWIEKTLKAYGVDLRHGATRLGAGSYKEAHRTNMLGVVAFVTLYHDQLEDEMIILELLAECGYPVMEYYCIERIGPVTIALARMLYPVDRSWDQDRQAAIRKQVESWLSCMLEEELFPSDLQFMVDENDQAVFTDPLHYTKDQVGYWDGRYHLDASCKDRQSSLYASATRRK